MTVAEVIRKLQQIKNQDRIVVMASDAEGNSYSPLARICEGAYKAETSYSGEVGLDELTPDDVRAGYTEEDVVNGDPCIILCPTN